MEEFYGINIAQLIKKCYNSFLKGRDKIMKQINLNIPSVLLKLLLRPTYIVLSLISIATLVFPTVSQADNADDLVKKLNEKFPKLVLPFKPAEVRPGLYEVFIDGQVAYTDKDLNFLVTGGSLVDPDKLTDITYDYSKSRQKVAFQSLPIDKSITTVYGNGKQKIALFIDPDCPYCKKFEQMLQQHKNELNLTVYRFWNPLTIHPGSREKAIQISCTSNPEKTLLDWMVAGTPVPAVALCSKDKDIDFEKALSRAYQFNSTPTILFEDNRISPEGLEYFDLIKILDKEPNPDPTHFVGK